MAQGTAVPCPDGIVDEHVRKDEGFRRHASPVSILILGGLIATALAGVFGGGKATVRTAETPAAQLTVATPHTLRNGVFFETRVTIAAHRDLKDATVAITRPLWRDQTINTTVPAAATEEYKDGAFRFRYGPLKAGETLAVKIDGQVNPPLFAGTAGAIMLLDGDARIASIPVHIRVLP